MANANLTAQRLREVLDYNAETGDFTWAIDISSTGRRGGVAGCQNKAGYVVVRLDKKLYLAHRLAVLHVTGEFPAALVDHRDTNKSNNRWANLRPATKGQNAQNKILAQKNNQASGLLGIYWAPQQNKWGAKLVVDGKQLHGGFHATQEAAHQAYILLKREHHTHGTL